MMEEAILIQRTVLLDILAHVSLFFVYFYFLDLVF